MGIGLYILGGYSGIDTKGTDTFIMSLHIHPYESHTCFGIRINHKLAGIYMIFLKTVNQLVGIIVIRNSSNQSHAAPGPGSGNRLVAAFSSRIYIIILIGIDSFAHCRNFIAAYGDVHNKRAKADDIL